MQPSCVLRVYASVWWEPFLILFLPDFNEQDLLLEEWEERRGGKEGGKEKGEDGAEWKRMTLYSKEVMFVQVVLYTYTLYVNV